jgi:putative hemolysin
VIWNTLLQVVIILALVVLNGVFALSEISLVSARKGRLKQRADNGDEAAKKVLELQEKPNNFLSTVQIGISAIGILSGALGSATLSGYVSQWFISLGVKESVSEQVSFLLVVLFTTYCSLIVGELIPKRIGMNNPEGIALVISRPMEFLSRLAKPIVKFLGWSTEMGIKILGIEVSDEPDVSEEEVRLMLLEGKEVGVFEESEHIMFEGVFRLGDRRVDMIVTPRTELDWIDIEDPVQLWDEVLFSTPFSRLPVVDGDLDHVIGVVSTKDLLTKRIREKNYDPMELIQPAIYIPESMSALAALNAIKDAGNSMAMVIDEYGGLLGIVTLFDLMEAVIGDVPLGDTQEDSIIEREDGSWLVDGLLPIDELKELLSLTELEGEKEFGYQTLGGYVMAQLGEVPQAGQFVEVNRCRFEIVDMDGRRVDKVMIHKLPDQGDE